MTTLRKICMQASCVFVSTIVTSVTFSANSSAGEAAFIPAAAPITYKMDKPVQNHQYSSLSTTPRVTSVAPDVTPPQITVPQIRDEALNRLPEMGTSLPTPSAPVLLPNIVPENNLPQASEYDLSNIDRTLYKHMKVGRAYKVAGKEYFPKHNPDYDETGTASWYGDKFHGKLTANGEIYDKNAFTAAHKTLPLNSYVIVTNLETGKQIKVRLNDRGPFIDGRIIDLSEAAAQALDYHSHGLSKVRVQYAGPADPVDSPKVAMLPESALPQTESLPVVPPTLSVPAVPKQPEGYQPLRRQAGQEAEVKAPVFEAPTSEIEEAPKAAELETPEMNIRPVETPFELPSEITEPTASLPHSDEVAVAEVPQDNLELSQEGYDTAEIALPEAETPEEFKIIPEIPTLGSEEMSEDGGITLTIKGPIHMASHTSKKSAARLIPAVFSNK